MDILKISLAAARVNADLTQEDVAKKLRISKNTLLNWEKGRSTPSYATMTVLSEMYGVPMDNIRLPSELT